MAEWGSFFSFGTNLFGSASNIGPAASPVVFEPPGDVPQGEWHAEVFMKKGKRCRDVGDVSEQSMWDKVWIIYHEHSCNLESSTRSCTSLPEDKTNYQIKLRDCLSLPSTLFKMEFDENRILFHVILFVFSSLTLQQLYVIEICLIYYLTNCLESVQIPFVSFLCVWNNTFLTVK